MEFGTKYCHNSPTLDEDKLHRTILEAINEFAQARTKVTSDMLEFAAIAWERRDDGGESLLSLRQRMKDISAKQGLLLDQVQENMDDPDLNAQLKELMDEKQTVQDQIHKLEQDEKHNAVQADRMRALKEWMAALEVNAEYSDAQVRMAIEKITVVDAETIRIKFKYPGMEIEKKLR